MDSAFVRLPVEVLSRVQVPELEQTPDEESKIQTMKNFDLELISDRLPYARLQLRVKYQGGAHDQLELAVLTGGVQEETELALTVDRAKLRAMAEMILQA